MHFDPEDRPQPAKRKTTWPLYLLIVCLSAIMLFAFAYLKSQGFGITVDLKKLSEVFVLNSPGNNPATTSPPLTSDPTPEWPAAPASDTQQYRPSQVIFSPSPIPPVNWEYQVAVFNSIYIRHPACNPHKMTWTQMACSNFRARAMGRFLEEWNKGAYWDGKTIIENKTASARVNKELTQ